MSWDLYGPCPTCGVKIDPAVHDCPNYPVPTFGMCTGCGSVEVRLNEATGTRDLSGMGESSRYPTGYGCETCS